MRHGRNVGPEECSEGYRGDILAPAVLADLNVMLGVLPELAGVAEHRDAGEDGVVDSALAQAGEGLGSREEFVGVFGLTALSED